MSEMIERVAKAIYDSHEFKKGWEHPDTKRLWHEFMRAEARAAIEAMREPTDEMLEASHYGEAPREPNSHYEVWKYMIDTALK